MTESLLIQELRRGNEDAVREWYEAYAPRLLKFIFLKVGNKKDAEELCHDTFLSCLDGLPLFRQTSSLFTWMCSVARHEVADYFRKKYAKRVIQSIPFVDALLPVHLHDMHEVSVGVQVVLAKLRTRHRNILLMKYVDGDSVEDIAQKLGLSFKSAESLLFRARQSFQAAYAAEFEEDR